MLRFAEGSVESTVTEIKWDSFLTTMMSKPRQPELFMRFYLVSYMALAVAVAIILSQVILLASRISPNEKPESDARKSEHPPIVAKLRGSRKKEEADLPLAKPKPHGRPKKEKLAEEQLKKEELKLPATHPEPA